MELDKQPAPATMEALLAALNQSGNHLHPDDVRSMLEMKVALDRLSVQLAVPKLTAGGLAALAKRLAAMKAATTPQAAAEAAFAFFYELARISGNTLIPLMYASFEKPSLQLWERYARKYGTEPLYDSAQKLCTALDARDADAAMAWAEATLSDTIHGNRQIYEE